MAKFPFEEAPAIKQGVKQEACPSSSVPAAAPAPAPPAVLDTEAKTGSIIIRNNDDASVHILHVLYVNV